MISLRENYSLKKHNSFGIDARARYFADIGDESDLGHFVRNNPVPELAVMILGAGSNVLFISDYDGLIIHPNIKGIEVIKETDDFITVRVGAGETWEMFVEWAVKRNYGGIENLSLIPGSVGACPVQNIGAYGCDVSQVIEQVETVHIPDGSKKIYHQKECVFGYRTSAFKTDLRGRIIITRVVFRLSRIPILKIDYGTVRERLQKYDTPSVNDVREVIIEIRNEKLPDPKKIGNAGSFFKNPVLENEEFNEFINNHPDAPSFRTEQDGLNKIPAAWLIEQCGWKGRRSGNTGTYPNQPLVLLNYGNATGKEIYEFSEKIRKDVFTRFRIRLEREVNLAGISS
jgi:UDP-N-acetylmuramate dehydrogenase